MSDLSKYGRCSKAFYEINAELSQGIYSDSLKFKLAVLYGDVLLNNPDGEGSMDDHFGGLVLRLAKGLDQDTKDSIAKSIVGKPKFEDLRDAIYDQYVDGCFSTALRYAKSSFAPEAYKYSEGNLDSIGSWLKFASYSKEEFLERLEGWPISNSNLTHDEDVFEAKKADLLKQVGLDSWEALGEQHEIALKSMPLVDAEHAVKQALRYEWAEYLPVFTGWLYQSIEDGEVTEEAVVGMLVEKGILSEGDGMPELKEKFAEAEELQKEFLKEARSLEAKEQKAEVESVDPLKIPKTNQAAGRVPGE